MKCSCSECGFVHDEQIPSQVALIAELDRARATIARQTNHAEALYDWASNVARAVERDDRPMAAELLRTRPPFDVPLAADMTIAALVRALRAVIDPPVLAKPLGSP